MAREPVAAALLAVLLCAQAGATSHQQVVGQLSTSGVESQGPTTITGHLLGLVRFDPLAADSGLDASFRLSGGQVRVATYESDPAIAAEGTWYAPVMPGYEPNTTTYSKAVVESLPGQTRDAYKVNVIASDGRPPVVRVSGGCEAFSVPDRQQLEAEWAVARPAEPVVVDVANAVRWTECGRSQVEVEGDFTLVLWEVQATLRTVDQTVDLQSGIDDSSSIPAPASGQANPTIGHRRQQYLYVEDGRLAFQMDSSPHFAYLAGPQVQSEGLLSFRHATGELRQGATMLPVQANSLALQGSLNVDQLRNQGPDQPLAVRFHGLVESGEADGQDLTLATTATQAVRPFPWAWVVGLGLAATVVAVPLAMRPARRLVARYIDGRRHDRVADLQVRCEDLIAVRRFQEARNVSATLLELDPSDPDLQFLRATVLGNLGRLGDDAACREALEHHAEAAKKSRERLADPTFVAENALQAALTGAAWYAHAPDSDKNRLHDLVLNWMAEAVRNEPCLEPDLGLHVELQPFLPTFMALLALKDSRAPEWMLP